eukprot:GHVT01056012.1.p1 GENE.GHVT01056012.1~~GHVT01056012.1.p1  ORF type:complete len:192 (+),score=54.16 GHVT01056012.1:826-1401(+)
MENAKLTTDTDEAQRQRVAALLESVPSRGPVTERVAERRKRVPADYSDPTSGGGGAGGNSSRADLLNWGDRGGVKTDGGKLPANFKLEDRGYRVGADGRRREWWEVTGPTGAGSGEGPRETKKTARAAKKKRAHDARELWRSEVEASLKASEAASGPAHADDRRSPARRRYALQQEEDKRQQDSKLVATQF